MSRKTIYSQNGINLIGGVDHMLGRFLQLFDDNVKSETPEGEGLIFDWSDGFGIETNFTGIPNSFGAPNEICLEYIKENDKNFVYVKN